MSVRPRRRNTPFIWCLFRNKSGRARHPLNEPFSFHHRKFCGHTFGKTISREAHQVSTNAYFIARPIISEDTENQHFLKRVFFVLFREKPSYCLLNELSHDTSDASVQTVSCCTSSTTHQQATNTHLSNQILPCRENPFPVLPRTPLGRWE